MIAGEGGELAPSVGAEAGGSAAETPTQKIGQPTTAPPLKTTHTATDKQAGQGPTTAGRESLVAAMAKLAMVGGDLEAAKCLIKPEDLLDLLRADHKGGEMETAMRMDGMRLALYNAALEGKPQDYYKVLQQTTTAMKDDGIQVMPNGNTVLHVAALHGRQHLVEKVLEGKDHTTSSSLLFAQNKKNQTALHCAAENGYVDIVSMLIQKSNDVESGTGAAARRMIQMTDNVTDTALHKAVRMGHLDVVKLLAEKDTEFKYPVNNAGETPIYIAAKSQLPDCLENWRNSSKYREISLCEMTDDSGWTALHYGIKKLNSRTVRMILAQNKSAAYISVGKGDEWTTAFHLAAMHGDVTRMEYISNSCPDSWMMVNSKCQNVLHKTVLEHKLNVVKYVLKHPQANSLIEGKDEDGNTPFDLLSVSSCNPLKRFAMQCLMWKQLGWKLVRKGGKTGGRGRGYLTEKPKVDDEKKIKDAEEAKEDIKLMLETSKANIIVSTLLLTVTFAAGFAVPGGFDSNSGKTQGMPILAQNTAFKIFVIANAISFIFSISSIWNHNMLVAEASSSAPNYITVKELYGLSGCMIYGATLAAIMAFCSGMYAILATLRTVSYIVVGLGGWSYIVIILIRVRAYTPDPYPKKKKEN
ncbi:PREDICTED: ankyrin repeat-containing protein ITN1-like [Ipomoea nil]|uniref:ankyrin repeat-containing protein ITN1-like n=1 Tax=Ipomoea nil TaxID=35883 RepID=UPI0009012A75|nr:PREDICTED: ankyrin repeat-containing protein ITN1-like [Ipomoea nil]